MSRKVTYKDIPGLLYDCKPFTANTMRAIKQKGVYMVYSYNVLIFDIRPGFQYDIIYFDNRYYSHTTSRQQNIIRRVYWVYNLSRMRVSAYYTYDPETTTFSMVENSAMYNEYPRMVGDNDKI